jgi:hypothetical protein
MNVVKNSQGVKSEAASQKRIMFFGPVQLFFVHSGISASAV